MIFVSGASSRLVGRFLEDVRGVTAVEFAFVGGPFFLLILAILQMGVYYMTQSALDAGVLRTADGLRNAFTAGTAPVLPDGATLKGRVAANGGSLIRNTSSLGVEVRQLSNLDDAVVPISDQTVDWGSTTSSLVIRAQSSVLAFAPGFGSIAMVKSSAIVRRQGR